jgi:hypothetical protein
MESLYNILLTRLLTGSTVSVLPLILILVGITVPLLFKSSIQPLLSAIFSLNVSVIVLFSGVVYNLLLLTGSVVITVGFVAACGVVVVVVADVFVVTGLLVVEIKFVLVLLVFALTEFIGFVTVGDKSLLTLEFILLVPLTAAADEALTFKIRAKANSKITEHIAFRLI